MGPDSPAGRLFRDAKVMEVIEGTTQIHQSIIGQWSSGLRHPADAPVRTS
ncbi:acyl-CoA dehydrogenase family protein [Streptomyces lydicus]